MSEEIVLSKINESIIGVQCRMETMMEMSDYFSFYADAYRFQPAYKAGVWDGKIRLVNGRTRTTYFGLLPQLVNFAKERDYKVRLEGIHRPFQSITREGISAFMTDLKPASKGKLLTPYDYQVDAVCQAVNRQRIILLSPTSSGKSLMIYSICRFFEKKKTLIVVPSVGLVTQMYNDFIDYSGINGYDVEKNCHMIYSGQKKGTEKDIIISTWQSIVNNSQEYFEQFEMVIVDECHLAEAKSIKTIMERCTNAAIRIGTTGTLKGTKTNKYTLIGLFGEPYKTITTAKLIEDGTVADLKINCVVLKHPKEAVKDYTKKKHNAESASGKKNPKRKLTYQDEIDFIVNSKERTKFIRDMVNSLEGNTLILFTRIEHGKALLKMFENRTTVFIDGSVSAKEREAIRTFMEENNDVVAIMSYGTSSTGMSIKNIQNIVFASPYKSMVKVLQSIGRVLRKLGNKRATVYDIADEMPGCTNNILKHFNKRVEIYSTEQFKFKIFSRVLKSFSDLTK